MRRNAARARTAFGVVAAVALSALATTAFGAAAAAREYRAAAVTPTCAGSTCAVSFQFTGAEQVFVVPAGVHSMAMTAVGAGGAAGGVGDPMPVGSFYNGGPDGAGGLGGRVAVQVSVTPGVTLFVEVGGRPTTDPARCVPKSLSATAAVSCVGGWNGGGDGGSAEKASAPAANDLSYAGGGGGASDVRTVSRTGAGTLSSRLVVAGGGGGGGGSDIGELNIDAATANGGAAGGNADSGGAAGAFAPGSGGAAGQPAGTSDGGSPAAPNPGHAGTLGLGGAGAKTVGAPQSPAQSAFLGLLGGGGGGGGGYWGGGGGGPQVHVNAESFTSHGTDPSTGAPQESPRTVLVAAVTPAARQTGGGGGGGGSWAAGKGAVSVPTADPAQVVLTWTSATAVTPSSPATNPSPVNSAGTPVPPSRVAPTPVTGLPLASTGSSAIPGLVLLGVLLVATGAGALTLVARRRA